MEGVWEHSDDVDDDDNAHLKQYCFSVNAFIDPQGHIGTCKCRQKVA